MRLYRLFQYQQRAEPLSETAEVVDFLPILPRSVPARRSLPHAAYQTYAIPIVASSDIVCVFMINEAAKVAGLTTEASTVAGLTNDAAGVAGLTNEGACGQREAEGILL